MNKIQSERTSIRVYLSSKTLHYKHRCMVVTRTVSVNTCDTHGRLHVHCFSLKRRATLSPLFSFFFLRKYTEERMDVPVHTYMKVPCTLCSAIRFSVFSTLLTSTKSKRVCDLSWIEWIFLGKSLLQREGLSGGKGAGCQYSLWVFWVVDNFWLSSWRAELQPGPKSAVMTPAVRTRVVSSNCD